jgi:hypothetical protein
VVTIFAFLDLEQNFSFLDEHYLHMYQWLSSFLMKTSSISVIDFFHVCGKVFSIRHDGKWDDERAGAS